MMISDCNSYYVSPNLVPLIKTNLRTWPVCERSCSCKIRFKNVDVGSISGRVLFCNVPNPLNRSDGLYNTFSSRLLFNASCCKLVILSEGVLLVGDFGFVFFLLFFLLFLMKSGEFSGGFCFVLCCCCCLLLFIVVAGCCCCLLLLFCVVVVVVCCRCCCVGNNDVVSNINPKSKSF